MVYPLRNRDEKAEAIPKRILVDATYTLVSGRHSGIERVVNNLRAGADRCAAQWGNRAETVLCGESDFYNVGPSQHTALANIATSQADMTRSLPKIYRHLVAPLVGLTGSAKMRDWFLPEPGHMGVFKLPHRYWSRHILKGICKAAQRTEPSSGDLLVLPDAYWARKEVWRAAAKARQRGAFVAVLVYDLIPLTHPEFVGERRTLRFAEYLKQVARHADMILTISETVRKELLAKLPGLIGTNEYARKVVSFPLGAEFSERSASPRTELSELFEGSSSQTPYLMVAAFDPRKNHRYLLDAFDKFWNSYPERKLCLVGRVGSRCDDVMERIRNHPRLGKQLFAFHDLSDAELQFCYRKSCGVIFPSIVEGFGLPIVEALWHGQRTLASDTPIHREVGGGHCKYFDLASPDALVKLLVECEQHAFVPSALGTLARPNSWAQCTEIFYQHCLEEFMQHGASLIPQSSEAA